MYCRSLKRLFDLGASIFLLIVLAPVIAVVGLVVLIRLGRPAIFRQERPGLGGRPFTMFKFRTMSPGKRGSGLPLQDSDRLSGLGRFLRSTSLDELPELMNVLRGEMTLVGPRPLLMRYLDRYSPEQARRHEVRPGITGWAQVNGRNAISWEEKFDLDVWYVDNVSFRLDLRILLMTCLRVIRRDGVSEAGVATASEFMGSPNPDGGDQS